MGYPQEGAHLPAPLLKLRFAEPIRTVDAEVPALKLRVVQAGLDAEGRMAGIFVERAETVLGLKAWEDAHEGTTTGAKAFVFFEAEKVIRMLLRQSTLAFETLATRRLIHGDPDLALRLLEAGLTNQIIPHYRDIVGHKLKNWSSLTQLQRQVAARQLYTARALHQHGVIAFEEESFSQLFEDFSLEKSTLESIHLQLESPSKLLPVEPSGYDTLHQILIALRLRSDDEFRFRVP